VLREHYHAFIVWYFGGEFATKNMLRNRGMCKAVIESQLSRLGKKFHGREIHSLVPTQQLFQSFAII
jgi:hypothetical protein